MTLLTVSMTLTWHMFYQNIRLTLIMPRVILMLETFSMGNRKPGDWCGRGWWVLGVRGTFWQMLLIHLSPACPCTCSRLYFFDGCIKNSNSRLYSCSIKTREVLGNPSHKKCEHNTNLWSQHKHMNTTPTCGWDEKEKLVEKRCLRLPPGLQSYPLQHLDRLHLQNSYTQNIQIHIHVHLKHFHFWMFEMFDSQKFQLLSNRILPLVKQWRLRFYKWHLFCKHATNVMAWSENSWKLEL